MFIKHSHLVDVAVIVIVLGLAVYLVASLFYLEPLGEGVGTEEQPKLTVELIEETGLWIEQRELERQRQLKIDGGKLFKEQVAN